MVGEGNGNPLQYYCLENPTDGGAWRAAVHELTKSRTQLRDFTFTFHFHTLEKEMGTHSSVLAWRIPGTGEPGGLPSMGSHSVGHDWSDLAAAAATLMVTAMIRTWETLVSVGPSWGFEVLTRIMSSKSHIMLESNCYFDGNFWSSEGKKIKTLLAEYYTLHQIQLISD